MLDKSPVSGSGKGPRSCNTERDWGKEEKGTTEDETPAFLMMYSAYKLNKQGDNIQP